MDLGFYLIFFAFIFSLYATYSFLRALKSGKAGFAEYGEKFIYIYTALIISSFFLLLYYFIVRDFNVAYVYSYSDSKLSLAYTISAIWAGKEGSLLLWVVFLSILNVAVLRSERKKDRPLALTLAISSFIFAYLTSMLLISNPFERLDFVPKDGYGLNPLLRTPEMAVHPPMVFLGYALTTIPFALAISHSYYGIEWERKARKWIILSWIFLTIGIVLGAIWSYKTLGWGGYWAWDPVENSSLLPWLMLTALAHSIMSDRLRMLNLPLAYLSFAFVIFATYVTRSGIVASVHAFGKSLEANPYLALIAFSGLISAYVYKRAERKALNLRDYTILLNILILILFAVPLIIGMFIPMISNMNVGRGFYTSVESPLAIFLAILIGICVAIRKDMKREIALAVIFASLTFFAVQLLSGMVYVALTSAIAAFSTLPHFPNFNIRRIGGFLVHIGVLLILIGVSASWVYGEHYHAKLNDEIKIDSRFGSLALKLLKIEEKKLPEKLTYSIYVQLYKNGKAKAVLKPSIDIYNIERQDRAIYRVSIYNDVLLDYYLVAYLSNGVYVDFYIEPLISLIWIGAGLMIIGGFIAVRKLY